MQNQLKRPSKAQDSSKWQTCTWKTLSTSVTTSTPLEDLWVVRYTNTDIYILFFSWIVLFRLLDPNQMLVNLFNLVLDCREVNNQILGIHREHLNCFLFVTLRIAVSGSKIWCFWTNMNRRHHSITLVWWLRLGTESTIRFHSIL